LQPHNRLFVAITVLSIGLLSPATHAQQGQWATDAPTTQPTAVQTPLADEGGNANSILADHLVTLARNVLNTSDVRKDQLVRCRILLDLALQTNPADADAWALRRELARLSDDVQGQFDALREYCMLRPYDDAAQLDLILTSADSQQTVEDRISTVEGVLQSEGGLNLSAPVRSRLSSYIAQQAGELGDEVRFGSWLKEAVAIDASNPHAALLTYELALAKGASPAALGQALLQVLRTNPLDAQSRRVLADLLMTQGAFEAAATQYLVVRTIGLPDADERFLTNWSVCLAASGRTHEALEMLGGLEASLKQVDPNSSFPINLELLRLTLLQQQGDTEGSKASFLRVRDYYHDRIQRGDDSAAMTLSWLTAVYSDKLSPQFEDALSQYVQRNPDDAMAMRTLAWVYMRNGKNEEATDIFHTMAEEDVFSVYGLAKCSTYGNSDLRDGYLNRAVQMSPASLAGLMAAHDLRQSGQSPHVTPAGAAISNVLGKLPRTISAPAPGSIPWTRIKLKVSKEMYGFLDPIEATLELTNRTNLPLELGPGGSIPSSVVVYLTLWQGGEVVPGVQPLVVDMRRALQIPAGATLQVPVRLDRNAMGHVMAYNATLPVGFTAAAVLDPQSTDDGSIGTGPLGSVDMVKAVYRNGTRPSSSNVNNWLRELRSTSDQAQQMRLVALLTQMTGFLRSEPSRQGDVARIAKTINDMYPNMTPQMQAWTVCFTPPSGDLVGLMPNVHQQAQRSDNALIQVVYLATQVADPNAPAMTAALRSNDPAITGYAQALRQAMTGR